ncbi:MAG: thiol:disulfide interchange protein [Alphaproteobacteria bacterium]|nr:thiol:disulfide interchange protein [Alphaproteobacteria bacterium]
MISLRSWARAVLGALALAGAAATAGAETLRTPQMESELVSARSAIAPGETFAVALRQRPAEGWHTYWINSGDSGEPLKIAWTMPPGFTAGEPQHPAPRRYSVATVMTFVHEGEFFFPVEITAPASLPVGQPVTLSAHIYYLVCADICITEEGDLSITLDTAAAGRDDAGWAPRIAAAQAALPQPGPEARFTAGESGAGVLSVAAPLAGAVRDVAFFPYDREAIVHFAPQDGRYGAGGVSVTLQPGFAGPLGQAPLGGVIAFETEADGRWTRRAYAIEAAPGAMLANTASNAAGGAEAPATAPGAPVDLGQLPLMIALAFIGGLILNVFPCVLPVLAIKGVALAQGAHAGRARRDGLFYLAGVVATFLALAGVLLALRAAGEAAGWAFQLQAPWLTAGLALLFFAIGLNFLGVFEVGGGEGLGQTLAARGGDAGAFFTGALAVIAASPCTGPFMAAALGFALAAPPAATLFIFLALALGFAAPLVALSFLPALQRIIPKPGPWMTRFRQVLAFAMFGAAVWLAWVLTLQTGAMGVLALMILATALGFLALVARWGRMWIAAALVIFLGLGAALWQPLTRVQAAPTQTADAGAGLAYEPWTVERVAALREEGRPVFVNFTAAWCVQCQVNEALVFRNARVAAAFEQGGVAALKADWTNRDDAIAAELERHQRAGIPFYLFYGPGAERPRILPQTPSVDLLVSLATSETQLTENQP